LKQAIDLVSGGKQNCSVLLRLDTSDRDFFRLIKDDMTVKAMVSFKQTDSIERRRISVVRSQYSSFSLKKLTAFQLCVCVDMQIQDEGVMELLFMMNDDVSIKYYVPAIAKSED
jgi:hypothetical protein